MRQRPVAGWLRPWLSWASLLQSCVHPKVSASSNPLRPPVTEVGMVSARPGCPVATVRARPASCLSVRPDPFGCPNAGSDADLAACWPAPSPDDELVVSGTRGNPRGSHASPRCVPSCPARRSPPTLAHSMVCIRPSRSPCPHETRRLRETRRGAPRQGVLPSRRMLGSTHSFPLGSQCGPPDIRRAAGPAPPRLSSCRPAGPDRLEETSLRDPETIHGLDREPVRRPPPKQPASPEGPDLGRDHRLCRRLATGIRRRRCRETLPRFRWMRPSREVLAMPAGSAVPARGRSFRVRRSCRRLSHQHAVRCRAAVPGCCASGVRHAAWRGGCERDEVSAPTDKLSRPSPRRRSRAREEDFASAAGVSPRGLASVTLANRMVSLSECSPSRRAAFPEGSAMP